MTTQHNREVIQHYKGTKVLYDYFCNPKQGHYLHYGIYDKSHTTYLQAAENAIKIMADLAGITSSQRVLDAGCGVGGSSLWIAKNVGARVTGINITPYQLEIAKQTAKEEGLENLIHFERRDYLHTRFPKKFFDVVWAQDSICHAESKESFTKEAFRLLKPNGRLVVCDGFLSQPRATLNVFLLHFLKLFEKGFALGELVSMKEFRDFLYQSGFKSVKVVNKTSQAHPGFVRAFFAGLALYFPLLCLEKLGRVAPEERRLALTGIIQLPGEMLGFGRYVIFVANKKKKED